MTLTTIEDNFIKNISSKKFVNNFFIGLNCTSIALKYVRLLLFSRNATFANSQSWTVPIYISLETIRLLNKMQFVDQNIEETNRRIFKDVTSYFISSFPNKSSLSET